MKKNLFLGFFIFALLTFAAAPAYARRTRRKPVVVPNGYGYVLVHGAYLRPIHGYHSLHPIFMPDPITTIIHLPVWNGVFWAYKLTLEPVKTVPSAF